MTSMRLIAVIGIGLLAAACGGGGDTPLITPAAAPTVPQNLTANVGTTAVSLGWDAPASTGSTTLQGYDVAVTPTVAPANIAIIGTRALVSGLTTGTAYTFTVRARNSIGSGPATAGLAATPRAVSNATYQAIDIVGDTSPTGVFDPSVLALANGELWMSYSSVNYNTNGSGQLVQDVGIRLARSTNNGATFTYQTTIATPSDITLAACGFPTCQGRWAYETSWLIDDSTDPNPARRYKLFAHKYFLRPTSVSTEGTTFYQLGAIVMWTASAPSGTWSSETSLLGWNTTPPELVPLRNANALHAELTTCLVVSEGSASVRGSTIDFAFACPYGMTDPRPQKIVLLRSADHATTFEYVSTLLTPADAAPIGAYYFSAPALLATAGTAPVLVVTPAFRDVSGDTYTGCIAIPFADDASGQLFRTGGLPVGILFTPPRLAAPNNVIGGACTYDRGLGTRGILQSNAPAESKFFGIYATQAALQTPPTN